MTVNGTQMTDPVRVAARAAAARLNAEYGPGLASDVEAALRTREPMQRPDQYADPISLGSLIVSITALAWTVYTDLKKKTPNPPSDTVVRTVRVELRNHGDTITEQYQEFTEVVVAEIIRTERERP